jgi:hypothetical protein
MIKKIISGGQTGADRAALDFAIKHQIPHGGWVPKGRLAEDGPLPDSYALHEMPTNSYPARTERNVIDSDGTLIVSHGKPTGGSDLTRKFAIKHGRSWLQIDLNQTDHTDAAAKIKEWIVQEEIAILNVAGPRASKDPRIYNKVMEVLELVFIGDMSESQSLKDGRISDPFLDRRSGDDRREAYELEYFAQGGIERRSGGESRQKGERRVHCVNVSEWSSVCPDKKSSGQ